MTIQAQSSMLEWVDIVDEQNQAIAQATRAEMRKKVLRHRACYIVVHNGADKILVQKRTEIKDFYPGWLDACAGGVVQHGEDVLDAARREAYEELGIADVPLAQHGTFYFESNDCCVWGTLFSCVSHGPFALQNEEIVNVDWLSMEEIEARKGEFTPDSLHALSRWFNRKDENVETIHIEIE